MDRHDEAAKAAQAFFKAEGTEDSRPPEPPPDDTGGRGHDPSLPGYFSGAGSPDRF